MDVNDRLISFYEKIIQEQAEKLTASITNRVIHDLRKMGRDSSMMQSDEDSGLLNIWDEICVQVQYEFSIFWDIYEDFLYDYIWNLIKESCTDTEIKILWMQTDSYLDWYYDSYDDDDEDHFDDHNDPLIEEGFMEHAVLLIKDKILARAGNYSNRRIRRFLDAGYEI